MIWKLKNNFLLTITIEFKSSSVWLNDMTLIVTKNTLKKWKRKYNAIYNEINY